MPPTHDPQLLKGVLSLLLLQLLAERESYGYEVVQRIHQTGLTDVLEGTVYPALARLEREGRVSARLVSSTPARRASTTGRPPPATPRWSPAPRTGPRWSVSSPASWTALSRPQPATDGA